MCTSNSHIGGYIKFVFAKSILHLAGNKDLEYEMEESEKAGSHQFDSRQLLAFSLSSIFRLIKFLHKVHIFLVTKVKLSIYVGNIL